LDEECYSPSSSVFISKDISLSIFRKYFTKCLKYVKGKKLIEVLNREIVDVKTRRSAV